MQDVIVIRNGKVIVQYDDKIYQDTKENFLKDYGIEIPYDDIDYNKYTENFLLNKNIDGYPNSICENILKNIDILLENKSKREYVEPTPPTDEELATQIRARRNSLLDATDYLMMPDYPISDDNRKLIEEYRQELRDITEQEGFPRNVTFPELEGNLNA